MKHERFSHAWLIFPVKSAPPLTKYTNRRFLEAAGAARCLVEIVDPNLMAPNLLDAEHPERLATKRPLPDFVIARSGANMGINGQNLLRVCQAAGVSVFPRTSQLRRAGDKLRSARKLTEAGLPTPRTQALSDVMGNLDKLIYPIVLKRAKGSQGKRVALCHSKEALLEAAASMPGRSPLIVQDFIASSFGRDIRVLISGGRAIAAIERRGADGDFRSNLAQGGHPIAVPLSEDIVSLSEAAARAMRLDFAGVDLLCGEESYLVCEVNSSPGFEGVEAVCSIDIAKRILDDAAQLHRQRRARGPDLGKRTGVPCGVVR
ncbi:MAG: RimK family alpha-L-glutamate ligase [Paracoccaceae bacterium]